MKRILVSLMTICLVGGLIGGGLFADFSDVETSRDNYFRTGALDLKVSDYLGIEYDDPWVPSFFNVKDAVPCCDKSVFIDLHNQGQGFQIDPYVYLHIKNLECYWVMPKVAYKWINCVDGECVVVPAPVPVPSEGAIGFGLPKPVTEPEFVAECGGIAGEDINGDPVIVPGVGCCYGEGCQLSRHVDVHIEVAGPYATGVHPTSETVPDDDWEAVDLSRFDTDPANGVIKMNELVCNEIELGQIPACNKIWVHIWVHLQDIDEDDLIAQDVLADPDPDDGYIGWFNEAIPSENKWDHWPTNAIQKDGMEFDMAFELLQNRFVAP